MLSKALPSHADNSPLFWLGILSAFMATLVVSAVLFLAIERPFSLRTRLAAAPVQARLPDATT